MKSHYKTIVLSDIHLGTAGSKAKEVTQFLKDNTCDRLILNGDIIDGWQLKKYGKWKNKHTKFFKRILKMIEDHNTQVIYLRGNHDDFLDQIIPIELGNIRIQRDYYLESNGKKFYVIHGDVFDSITTNLKWVAKLGDVGYTFLLWLNQRYNNYRIKRGLPYYSLSQAIKQKVKSAVSYVNSYEEQLCIMARIKKCDGIICGHIHQAAQKVIDGIIYYNSGDWVESLTALVEDHQGNWEIIYFKDKLISDSHEEEDEDRDNSSYLNDLLTLREEMKLMKRTS
ncbi:MAG: UDP-2,3-diacylglucosamine diphosphatase [Cytophagaceae bacterium]|nr:UDP-2,3-diacylglucosamine diphosphatase [Cytophagaceae bacterium]MDW8457138.1 UDP-2,3-diacylglucosamine diphosphatase [Cytophagaceae bacterium]